MSTPPDLGPLPCHPEPHTMTWTELEREVIRDFGHRCYMIGVAAEREACAKVCDVTPPYPFRPSIEAAHAIRQRARTAAPSEPTKEGG